MLHGYTGSPLEFHELAEFLASHLHAHVTVPLLPGHGGSEEELLAVSFEEFRNAAHTHTEHIARTGKPFAIIGNSFGGLLATLSAAEFPPTALVLALTPYKLCFPFKMPGMAHFLHLRRWWGKATHLSKREVRAHKHLPYYVHTPGMALTLIRIAHAHINMILPRIACPVLALQTENDPIVHPSSGSALIERTQIHPDSKSIILPHRPHRAFFGRGHSEVEHLVLEFLEKEFAKI